MGRNAQRRRKKRDEDRKRGQARRAQPTATYWNGERCEARKVTITVADGGHERGWYRPFIGQQRDAVEVTYAGQTFYLDDAELGPDAAGAGWRKVTEGHGGPSWGHRSLYKAAGSGVVAR